MLTEQITSTGHQVLVSSSVEDNITVDFRLVEQIRFHVMFLKHQEKLMTFTY